MTTFDDFIRKWGKAASLAYGPNGTVKVVHRGDDALLILMAGELDAIPASERRRGKEARSVRLTQRLVLSPANARNWNVVEDDILKSTTLDGKHPEKFSWNPVTGEFLFVWPGQMHVSVNGKAPFDDYVRGVVLHQQKLVTFRPFWPTWVQKSSYGEFDQEAAIVSFDAQYDAQQMIKRNSSTPWNFRVNITNKQLEEVTGRHRW